VRQITGFYAFDPVKLQKMPVSIHLISQIPLLKALPPEELTRLSQEMVLQEYPRRGVVLAKDSPGKSLGFLITGRLQGVDFTVDGRSVGLYFVESGDYFGEISVIDGKPPAEFVIAASQSVVAHLNLAHAQQLILKYPTIAQQLLVRMASRVRTVIAQRTLLGLPNPVQRLCVLLMQLPGRQGTSGYVLDPAPTHQELAIMINTSRETVTRAFQVMTQQKILIREGNQLKVLQLGALKDIAEGRKDSPKTSS
jgi:CRP/FNR family cyclic AMP-dependent transcriptional regulator